MKITFLGTGSMLPTEKRNLSSILLSYENENILFDCAEGTQRQLKVARISPTKITKILISHWHSDHVLGLPGLLQTIAAFSPRKTIDIFGPIGTKKFIDLIQKTFIPRHNINIKINEIAKKGKILDAKKFYLEASYLDHTSGCLGFSFIEKDRRKINIKYLRKLGLKSGPILKNLQEGKSIVYKNKKISPDKATTIAKGRKITILLDTRYCKNAIDLAKSSTLLITEAMFLEDLKELAKEYGHLTAKQAAQIAKKSNSKKLILTHFSQRYKTTDKIKKEARSIFKSTEVANDFLSISL